LGEISHLKRRREAKPPIVTKIKPRKKKKISHTTSIKKYGDHVREIVPAPLFQEGNAHFDGA